MSFLEILRDNLCIIITMSGMCVGSAGQGPFFEFDSKTLQSSGLSFSSPSIIISRLDILFYKFCCRNFCSKTLVLSNYRNEILWKFVRDNNLEVFEWHWLFWFAVTSTLKNVNKTLRIICCVAESGRARRASWACVIILLAASANVFSTITDNDLCVSDEQRSFRDR